MSKAVHTKVFIAGQQILKNISFNIEATQKMAQHQELKLTHDFYGINDTSSDFAQQTLNLIGFPFKLEVWESSKRDTNIGKLLFMYQGVVTDVSIIKDDGGQGHIVVLVKSPTELLTHGKDSMSYEKKNLNDIICEATREYPNNIVDISVNPRFTDTIPYTVQYKENDFDFICRLAKRYGEWFYYDGHTINFGANSSSKVDLILNAGLDKFTFRAKSRPQNYNYLGYDYQSSEVHTSSMKDENQKSKNPYIDRLIGASKNLYAKEPIGSYNNSSLEGGKKELADMIKLKAKAAHNMLYVQGESENTQVKLGGLIDIKGKNINDPSKEDVYGTYIVTSLSYKITPSEEYSNEFEGVPQEIDVPDYYDEDAVPLSEEQFAVVTDNNDPKGMGRVRVSFPWQAKNGGKTPWIRLSTGHGGGGKGFYFIPEIGEEVLVVFEGGNAENPYVIGTRYNSKQQTPVKDPSQKIIQTRSGNKIVLNDADGSVSIYDKGTASIKMDGAGNIEVNADKKLTINISKDKSTFEMNEGNVTLKAKDSIKLEVGKTKLELKAKSALLKTTDAEIATTKSFFHSDGTTIITGKPVAIN
ncbi:phage baseplate assembly protein V [Bernardetia sp. Wsw4-3y2]|uniref:type VI secretion system Vgr family protein n=1 Tax=Bernardetia sp. Wsw4-3y2 TaxID=3127471 RepID=UPI0030CC670F